jgi:hypothetical protein
MNFEETPIQQELREFTRRFAQKELAPIVEEDELCCPSRKLISVIFGSCFVRGLINKISPHELES